MMIRLRKLKKRLGQEEIMGVEVMVEGVEETLSSIVEKEKEKPEQPVKKK